MTLLICVALVVLTFSDAVLFGAFMPRIPVHLTRILSVVSNINSLESNDNLTTNASAPWQDMKELVYESAEAQLFISPYISTLKRYNTSYRTRPSNFSRKHKVIGCYNCPTWFINHNLNQKNRDFKACPYSECTFDPGNTGSTADVVLFFVGMLGKKKLPERRAGQIWVKCYWESPAHYSYPSK